MAIAKCQNCSADVENASWDYCPWCGQDFRKRPEDSEGGDGIQQSQRTNTRSERLSIAEKDVEELSQRVRKLEKWAEDTEGMLPDIINDMDGMNRRIRKLEKQPDPSAGRSDDRSSLCEKAWYTSQRLIDLQELRELLDGIESD